MSSFRKTADSFIAGTKTLPQRYFVSDEVFAREAECIFSKHWLCIGHQSQIAQPGDFFLQQIGKESLIILRDSAKNIRAFFNVCRHRGTRLCEQSRGQFHATIQCPYHAWTYNLEGELIGAPHMADVSNFDKSMHALSGVALESWEGFLFVNLAENPQPLDSVLAPLAGKFSSWNLLILRSAKQIEYEVRANWKLIFQNYSECYHCPLVHPGLAKLSPYDAAENDLSQGPLLGGFMPLLKGSLTTSGNHCAPLLGNLPAEDRRRVFYYSLFPNMLLSIHPDYVLVYRIWPRTPDRVTIVCDWLFHPEAFGREDFCPADAAEFWDLTNRQDWHVCELSQLGIASRAYQPGPYSPRESLSAEWDREYLRALGE